ILSLPGVSFAPSGFARRRWTAVSGRLWRAVAADISLITKFPFAPLRLCGTGGALVLRVRQMGAGYVTEFTPPSTCPMLSGEHGRRGRRRDQPCDRPPPLASPSQK